MINLVKERCQTVLGHSETRGSLNVHRFWSFFLEFTNLNQWRSQGGGQGGHGPPLGAEGPQGPLDSRVWQGPSRNSGLAMTLPALGSGKGPPGSQGLEKAPSAFKSWQGPSWHSSLVRAPLGSRPGKGPPGSCVWQGPSRLLRLTRALLALKSGKGPSRLSGLARALPAPASGKGLLGSSV